MSTARGMASAGREAVGPLVLPAWDAFLEAAEAADLLRPTRLAGWRGQEVCVHLGYWDDHRALDGMITSARAGRAGPAPDPDAVNARVTARHRDAGRAEVLRALRRHRDAVAAYLRDADPALDLAPAASTVGPLPLLSVVLGEAYELAVHGLDLRDCGAPPPPASTLSAGLAALADVTGALAARCGIEGGVALLAPDTGWRLASDGSGWTVTPATGAQTGESAVEGDADALLDAAAGRANAVALLARRRLRVRSMAGLLRLAPVVEAAPGIPGAPILAVAARSLEGAGGLAGRLLGRG